MEVKDRERRSATPRFPGARAAGCEELSRSVVSCAVLESRVTS
jgi:hypothetical protein